MLFPDGSLIIAVPLPLEKRIAELPDERTSLPPSPALISMFEIRVPSGILLSGSMLPFEGAAESPRDI
jgi:hypothetical protein